jgi:hypothetical protein
MDRGRFGAGASDDRFPPKRQESWWLYDPISEEFRRVPGTSEERWLDDRIRGLRPFGPRVPRSRWDRLAYSLFTMGWMCPVFFCGLMVFALIVWLMQVH